MWAVVEVEAALGLVVGRVVNVLGFVQTQHFLLNLVHFRHIFLQSRHICKIHE